MTQQTDQLLLIDLSGIAHQVWHVSGEQNDPSYVSRELVRRVRDLASAHPYAAICCDNGKSFRKEIDPTYKANRDTDNRAPLYHQMTVACDILKQDGFPVWSVKGYEADDLIATATTQALAIDGTSVLIASSDKDLLQLVSDRVTAKSIRDGKLFDAAAVTEKFRVKPEQMLDYLSLVGDKSDNILGARGIGEVNAAKLLNEHGSLGAVYAKMAQGIVPGMSIGIRTSLQEFKDRWPLVRELITLRTDAPIELSDIAAERTAPPMTEETPEMSDNIDSVPQQQIHQVLEGELGKPRVPFQQGNDANDAPLFAEQTPQDVKRIIDAVERPKNAQIVPYEQPAAPADFSQQLEPRTMPEAITLAKHMFESRLFGAYGTPQAVLSVILAGRELGMPAMASLRSFHIVENRATMSAGLLVARVLQSGKAKYFRCSERTDERATYETQRGDDPPISLSYTMKDAEMAGLVKDKSGWKKNPSDMLVARASSKLARLVYPDVCAGLYATEEF